VRRQRLSRVLVGSLSTGAALIGAVLFGGSMIVDAPLPVAAVELPAVPIADRQAPMSRLDELHSEIVDALSAPTWPRLRPTVAAVTRWSPMPPDVEACGETGSADLPAHCTWGDPAATRHAVVIGDSIAMAYVEALRTAFSPGTGWQVTALGSPGCSFIDAEVEPEVPAYAQRCPRVQARAERTISEMQPDVVFVAQVLRANRVAGGPVSNGEWARLVTSALRELPSSTQVVVLGRPPSDKDIAQCYDRAGSPDDCVTTVTDEWQRKRASERAVARSVGGAFVDPEPWFCAQGSCPAFVDNVPTKADQLHMSRAYGRIIGPAVWEALRDVLPAPAG
jgi:hypothetical protein